MKVALLSVIFLLVGTVLGQQKSGELSTTSIEIPRDSITSQLVKNEFLLGSWKFHSLELENKKMEKVLIENSKKLEFKFYTDHSMRWINDQDTAQVYWALSPKEDHYDLRVYQPLGNKKLHGEPAVLEIHKLRRKKLVIQMSYQGVEALETPFLVIFKRT